MRLDLKAKDGLNPLHPKNYLEEGMEIEQMEVAESAVEVVEREAPLLIWASMEYLQTLCGHLNRILNQKAVNINSFHNFCFVVKQNIMCEGEEGRKRGIRKKPPSVDITLWMIYQHAFFVSIGLSDTYFRNLCMTRRSPV